MVKGSWGFSFLAVEERDPDIKEESDVDDSSDEEEEEEDGEDEDRERAGFLRGLRVRLFLSLLSERLSELEVLRRRLWRREERVALGRFLWL